MKTTQLDSVTFQHVASISRIEDRAQQMAKAVLIDGRGQAEVAKEFGVTRQRVHLAVASIARACDKIRPRMSFSDVAAIARLGDNTKTLVRSVLVKGETISSVASKHRIASTRIQSVVASFLAAHDKVSALGVRFDYSISPPVLGTPALRPGRPSKVVKASIE